jgi:hypothetical protein
VRRRTQARSGEVAGPVGKAGRATGRQALAGAARLHSSRPPHLSWLRAQSPRRVNHAQGAPSRKLRYAVRRRQMTFVMPSRRTWRNRSGWRRRQGRSGREDRDPGLSRDGLRRRLPGHAGPRHQAHTSAHEQAEHAGRGTAVSFLTKGTKRLPAQWTGLQRRCDDDGRVRALHDLHASLSSGPAPGTRAGWSSMNAAHSSSAMARCRSVRVAHRPPGVPLPAACVLADDLGAKNCPEGYR